MFKLNKSFGKYERGRVFNSYEGLVQGITDDMYGTISFIDREWFEYVKS